MQAASHIVSVFLEKVSTAKNRSSLEETLNKKSRKVVGRKIGQTDRIKMVKMRPCGLLSDPPGKVNVVIC